MATNAVALAWRSAGRRAPALHSLRATQRPSILHRESLLRQVRYSSDAASQTKEAAKETTAQVTETVKEAPKKTGRKLKRTIWGTSLALTLLAGFIYGTDTRASVHRYGVVPLVRLLFPDAEDAHHFGVDILKTLYKYGLNPRERGDPDSDGALLTEVFGYTLSNPIGISGGLDKHADIPDPLFELGPAIVEVGGTTPLPQEGNPRPRVFRLPSQNAMINRYGLNSKGADHMAAVLEQRVRDYAYAHGFGEHELAEQRVLNGEAGVPPGSLREGKLLAVQVAKNKLTPDNDIEAIKRDYVYCVDRLAKYADILVVNVSSPNTPGLRDLQATAPLTAILKAVVGAAKSIDRKTKPFVMVKVSPDEDADEQVSGICDAVWGSGVDGVIVGNTTNRRPEPLPKGFTLPSKEQDVLKETGGFSGPQLFDRTVKLVAKYKSLLDASAPASAAAAAAAAPKAIEAAEPDVENVPPTVSEAVEGLPARKVIFASGGVTNGEQARKVLDAGASVAMMYTAITYGGLGTVTRVKEEMKEKK
ncbi:dihydroorotate dehydrogenase 2 [Aspergillus vadensis CBS 113365]|uniref:Dihydroorotate dehydrogenase (quinone), mitochondrial n=1 Tax=Aspergillus vadensis (strain CBS 113365 / IMI 142717 / IBT 24658) TaxID=1448311 RepID=A0A319BQ88_ASPVC|nr:dihydroorotate reductase pyre [Aspergillus vadensis CBS 113365]PYH74574.1 dihydroorotate reductase pyre [Aspergillus vadensis CBS 113365]